MEGWAEALLIFSCVVVVAVVIIAMAAITRARPEDVPEVLSGLADVIDALFRSWRR